MTKKEIEAYRANFEYGRKCWAEFAETHPVDGRWEEKPERKINGEDPFSKTPELPKPVERKEQINTPASVVVQNNDNNSIAGIAAIFLTIFVLVCALVLFALLLG